VHFAQYMAREGYRVLLVDLDSQGSATAQFGIDPSSEVGLDNSFAAGRRQEMLAAISRQNRFVKQHIGPLMISLQLARF
jgi:cellulose biosynthesis protein BcsQ